MKVYIIIFLSCFSICYSEPFSKLKIKNKLIKGLSDAKNIISKKESIIISQNKNIDIQDINWINNRLKFIYETNKLMLDEFDKILDFDIDTTTKDNIISLYLNPLANRSNPKGFSFYQELNMVNNDDIKFILHTCDIIKKNGWFLNSEIPPNNIFSIWITLVNSRFFDCEYQDEYIIPTIDKLIVEKKISSVGLIFLSNILNNSNNNVIIDEVESIIIKEKDPIWIDNLSYIKTIYKLNNYVIGLKNRKIMELEEEKLLQKNNVRQ